MILSKSEQILLDLLLSHRICTLAHVTSVSIVTSKVIKEAEIRKEGFSLIFIIRKTIIGQQYKRLIRYLE